MYAKSLAAGALTAALTAQALSSQCTGSIGSLAIFGSLGSCLKLQSALPLIEGNGPLVSGLSSYFDDLCASGTPTCSNSTLTSAESTISSACSSDLSSGGSSATDVNLLLTILNNYSEVKTAACAKNSSANEYCVTNTLYTIQNVTGNDVSVNTLTNVLQGQDSDEIQQAVQSGRLCTGCVQEIYKEAVMANSSVADNSLASSLKKQCGNDFLSGSSSSQASGVSASTVAQSTSSMAATSSAAAAASSTHHSGAGHNVNFNVGPWVMVAGTAVLGLAVGGAAVL